MNRKFLNFIPCVFLALSLAACSSTNTQTQSTPSNNDVDTQAPVENSENSSQEAMLGPDATDQELLDLLSDDLHVVMDDDYIKMVSAITENTDEYAGQIYQIEGSYTVNNGTPYLTRTIVDGEGKTPMGLPLKYLPGEPEEGSWVRITGVVNTGEVNGETVAVLEVAVSEILEEQGQVEIQLQ